ncbi:uncharacterized protein LOC119563326 isoform X1 [Drosophila subpulchrella]|uniref:uncharacterized protein LOC119563326 isoform X1 n=1 Tax=Drosophila subpulchrella TaxID=1486046 RepID=UPI0018A135F0|nr:uncharacterized protein LOC119563326 isoform X1 [Drosophila subpulchrella]
MTDKKKDDIGRAENIAVVEQMPALLERNLAKLRSENALRAAYIADMKKQLDALMTVKYGDMSYLNYGEVGPNLLPELRVMIAKNGRIIETLDRVVQAKSTVARAYDDHCKRVLKAKEAQKVQRVYDEFTAMPHYELKQRIAEVKSEAAESRAKLTLKIKEVREKKELLKATKKSLLADIRALAQVERDAIDTVEELKSEIAIKNAMRAIK